MFVRATLVCAIACLGACEGTHSLGCFEVNSSYTVLTGHVTTRGCYCDLKRGEPLAVNGTLVMEFQDCKVSITTSDGGVVERVVGDVPDVFTVESVTD